MVTADSDGPVEVCVPVRHPPQDPAELAWRVEPAHLEAFISVTRTHFEIPAIWSIYDRLARWVAAPGRRRAGAPREVYRPEAEPLFAPAGQQNASSMASLPSPGARHHERHAGRPHDRTAARTAATRASRR